MPFMNDLFVGSTVEEVLTNAGLTGDAHEAAKSFRGSVVEIGSP